MRWIAIVCCAMFVLLGACSPDMIDHTQKDGGTTKEVTNQNDGGTTDQSTNTEQNTNTEQDTTTDKSVTACSTDCDCLKLGWVCEKKTCQALRRKSNCLSCSDPACPSGEPCANADQSIGVCKTNGTTCKDDCNCKPSEICNSGTCKATGPAGPTNACVACTSKACVEGKPCRNQDGTLGTCSGNNTKTCKHDCDCVASGMVCDKGVCAALRRATNCLSCTDSNCKEGDPCLKADKSIGTCESRTACKESCDCPTGEACISGFCKPSAGPANQCVSCSSNTCEHGKSCREADGQKGTCKSGYKAACKHDCDCVKYGLLCGNGQCLPLKRLSQCLSCTDSNCKEGDPCQNADKSIGTCGKKTIPCKHDCDCVPHGLLCNSGTCAALRRLSQCLACTSPNCKKGDPCQNKDKTFGVCGGTTNTFACGPTQCQSGKEYCQRTIGGVRPSCNMPGQASCPSNCRPRGLNCSDGKVRCDCGWKCIAFPPACTDCKCLSTGPCTCSTSNGNVSVTCALP